MRFAAVADIHGNAKALEAVLADIAALGIREIVNLGDHVSGPLEAARTADLLMESDVLSIRGDQDRRLVEFKPHGSAAAARADFRQLEGHHLQWLASLPETQLYRDDVFLCHGSPLNDASYWLDRVAEDGSIRMSTLAEIEAEAEAPGCSLILCGHTHIPRAVRLSDGRLIVNPGSVGCPGYDGTRPVCHVVQTGTPSACYALLERSRLGWSVTLRQIPYEHEPMAALAAQNGFLGWARALETGWFA
jgi:predicted phosphodiesterase